MADTVEMQASPAVPDTGTGFLRTTLPEDRREAPRLPALSYARTRDVPKHSQRQHTESGTSDLVSHSLVL
jgi:hypothetical protein